MADIASHRNESGELRLLAMAGDGIGPEIVPAALAVLEAARERFGLPVAVEEAEIGWAALERSGSTLPDAVVERARAADGVILGPVSHNDYPPAEAGGLNPSGELRKALDLYANLRPIRSLEGIKTRYENVDLIVVRENTEDLYSGLEHEVVPGVVESRLDFRRGVVDVTWDPALTQLSAIAHALDSLGYPPHPSKDGEAQSLRTAEDRRNSAGDRGRQADRRSQEIVN